MADYIKREDAKKIIDHALMSIGELPFEEPEIIRCKDCKHYRDGHTGTDCCWDFEYNERRQTPDSYCSGAERRASDE